jgi:prophage regulatory protein
MTLNQTNKPLRIERKQEVLQRVGLSNATLHRRIKEGTFPPSINLGGAKAVGFISHEVDAFIIACAQGADHKRVVAQILKEREKLKQASPLLQSMDLH